MPATAVTFAYRRDITTTRARRPRIRADGDLCSLWPTSQRYGVSRVGKQIIRDELVEAFVTLVHEIELHDAVFVNCLTLNFFKRIAMLSQDRFKTTLDL